MRCIGLIAVFILAASPAWAQEDLILPHPALLRAQQLLRQAEQEGARTMQPMVVLSLQEKINAAWSAYHRQVEEAADDPDDEEAITARRLAEEVALDAELLQVTLRTENDEARLDGLRANLKQAPAEPIEAPSPDTWPEVEEP